MVKADKNNGAGSKALRVTYSAFQVKMLNLLTEISPYGGKETDVAAYIVTRELDRIYEENRFGIRELLRPEAK